jgi:aminopeptidase YwaD
VLTGRIEHHLHVLAERIGPRPPGSPANRRATAHLVSTLTDAGLEVRTDPFRTRWWEPGPGHLFVGDQVLDVEPNPFSPPGVTSGRVTWVADLGALHRLADEPSPRVIVLTGQLTHEPLLPAVFPFLEVAEHRAVTAAIVAAQPAAVIAISDGGQPILEDPDLGIPSVTMRSDAMGVLVDGAEAVLQVGGAIHRGGGVNVSARTGGVGRRIVLSAHVDTKVTSPGALDNAAGVAVLLALADEGLLPGGVPIELVLFNGEDHPDACGEVAWLAETALDEVAAVINLDGVGLRGRGSSIAMLACPAAIEQRVTAMVDARPGWTIAPPWHESDHAIFAMRGIPALALTTNGVHELIATLVHTVHDTVEVVDVGLLADVARTVAVLAAMLAPLLAKEAVEPADVGRDDERVPVEQAG